MIRALGWIEPATRGRPHQGRIVTAFREVHTELPVVVDLRPALPAVYDQGSLGSCVAQALAGCVEYLQRRLEVLDTIETPSRLALYYEARALIGHTAEDSGAIIADGIAVLRSLGWAPEDVWPYDVDRYAQTPPYVVHVAGRARRLVTSEPLAHDLGTLRWELACGHPVAAGIRVYDPFNDVGEDGAIPGPGGRYLGGHAVALVGYDAARGAFLVRNSWGPSWGDGGYGWIPESYVLDPSECGELHALRAVRVLREGRL